MRRKLIIFCCFLGALCISNIPALGDIYIDYNYADALDGTLTTPYSGSDIFVETFNDAPTMDQPSWTWTGNGTVRLGSDDGAIPMKYAAPYNSSLMTGADDTYYYSVPQDMVGEEVDWSWAMVDFGLDEGETYDYLGLFWGSVDTYNIFEFIKDGQVVESFTGSIITDPNPANGSQTAPYTNLYVNFYNLPEFDAVKFISTGYAFEFDNLAVGLTPIPVPGAVLLGILGLSIAGIKLRKFA